jgi:toxin HigB-1
MHQRIFARLGRLDVAVRPGEMNIPGFDFRALQGFNPKRYSVRVDGPWCISFEFEDGEACRVDFEQYHLRSQHGLSGKARQKPLPYASRRAASR